MILGHTPVYADIGYTQELNAKSHGSGDRFDYIHGAIDCPTNITITTSVPENRHFAVGPIGLRFQGTHYIEGGWWREGEPGTGEKEPCVDKYCAYAAWISPATGYQENIDHNITFEPTQRPWAMVHRDLAQCDIFKYKAWVGRGAWNEMTPTGGIPFFKNFDDVVSGIEHNHPPVGTFTASWHRHQENHFSRGCDNDPQCGCAPNGIQSWCFDFISPSHGTSTPDPCNSGNEWATTVP
jgi:hypothetical protein